ncbi:unnamed protein product (macronuclear) [Paramecium tetraurelia]|uniref:PAP-associated domain-containing protein n=1 Tax=Paramecium tetraurelia TaxID=5888 RepID=A0E5M5_PARTE|nr:uncharacterized protein GSPATT00003453001 [Paramecium tetraurelia]CAK90592.1 unnamed protein product [Paramecium tetraurelia]|eukprot:XP_001457989.1 hypothetical protein (macronuclear) [Paramecium tetraurelia strain d4-2]
MNQLDDLDIDEDFLVQPANQFIDDDQNEDDIFDEPTQTFVNDNMHINEETRKKINNDFKEKLERFVPKLFQQAQIKTREIIGIKQILNSLKISDKLILEQRQKERQEQNNQNQYNGPKQRIQKRNTEEFLIDKLKKHLIEGSNLNFTIHDLNYTQLYLCHNPCVIFIKTQHPYHTLDIVNQMLRNLKNPQLFEQDKFNTLQNEFGQNCLKLVIQQMQYNHLVVQIPGGSIKFEIKAGNENQNLDIYKDQIMNVYCQINPELKKICAFLNYWAYQRGILGDHALPEFALYCMIIDFFMTQSLIPNIFSDQYSQWSQEKLQLKQKIKDSEDCRLSKFNKDEYIIQVTQKNGRKVEKIFWLSFPRSKEEIKGVIEQWTKTQEKQYQQIPQFNIGYQISVFFHLWNQVEKYKVPLALTSDVQKEGQEIGLIIYNPFIKNQILTPLLQKRQKNEEFKSSNMYQQVRQEFKRAYDLILSCNFAELCDKQQIL